MTLALDQAIIPGGQFTPDANIVVNGFMDISQEQGAAAITAASSYGVDQWYGNFALTGAVITRQQVASPFPSFPGIRSGQRLRTTTAQTPAAGDYVLLYQPIEGWRMSRLGWGTALAQPLALAFVVRSNFTGVGYVRFHNAAADKRFLRRFAFTANEDTFVQLTIPPETTGVWPGGAAAGAYLQFIFGAGATSAVGPVDVWSATAAAGADISQIQSVLNLEVIVSGVFAAPGPVSPNRDTLPFLRREYDAELQLCQRYWESGMAHGLITATAVGQYLEGTMRFREQKRVTPTMTYSQNFVSAASARTESNLSIDGFIRLATSTAATGTAEFIDNWFASARM